MTDLMEAVTGLAKRRGIAFQSAEIYGGLRSSWDYGPLGVELRRNIRNAWWRTNVQLRDDVVGVEAAIDHESSCLAGERTPRDVPRPARRMHELPPALARGSSRGQRQRRGALPELRRRGVHRAEAVQPDAEDLPRADRGRRRRRLPASRDRAGHVRQLPGDPDRLAQEAPVRHRADRQVVPQRDHARELHLPHPRVRADGDGVLRRARHRRRVVRVLGRAAPPVVPRPRRVEGETAAPSARTRRARALRQGRDRRRVRVPVRLAGARGHRQPHRLRPRSASDGERRGPHLLRPGQRDDGSCRT